MNIPGYDDWRLRGPDEDEDVCPICGARNSSLCQALESATDGCPWEEAHPEPDPDYLRDLRDDR